MIDSEGNTVGAPPPVVGQGLTDNIAGGLAYITMIPAIVFLVLAPYNQRRSVRFNCWQSILLWALAFVISLFYFIPILGIIALILRSILGIVILIVCILTFTGKTFVVPGIGTYAEKLASTGAPVL